MGACGSRSRRRLSQPEMRYTRQSYDSSLGSRTPSTGSDVGSLQSSDGYQYDLWCRDNSIQSGSCLSETLSQDEEELFLAFACLVENLDKLRVATTSSETEEDDSSAPDEEDIIFVNNGGSEIIPACPLIAIRSGDLGHELLE